MPQFKPINMSKIFLVMVSSMLILTMTWHFHQPKFKIDNKMIKLNTSSNPKKW